MNVNEEAEVLVKSLLAKLDGCAKDFQFLIPDWKLQDSEMGVRWMKSQIWEGFSVSYDVDFSSKCVHLKSWEDDELE